MIQNLHENGSPPKLEKEETQSCKQDWNQDCQQENKLLAKIDHDDVQLIAMKCSCGSSWCPVCSLRRWAPESAKRLRKFDWERTRQVILTIDPNKEFETGQSAYEYMKEKKAIPQLIHNLKRTKGIGIVKWMWFLEWHRNGNPHWHLFIALTPNLRPRNGIS